MAKVMMRRKKLAGHWLPILVILLVMMTIGGYGPRLAAGSRSSGVSRGYDSLDAGRGFDAPPEKGRQGAKRTLEGGTRSGSPSKLTCPAAGQELLNCLVARIDQIPVTAFDLEVLKTFELLPGVNSEALTVEERLDRYIDVILVLRLTRENVQVSQEEVSSELDRLRDRLGSEILEQKCQLLGLTPEDLGSYLQDKILFEKVIGTRFNQRLYVSLKEIEDYYQQVYVPEQKAAGRTPPELVTVLDEIEARLQARRREERVKEWTGELRQRAEVVVYTECLNRIK